MSTTLTIRNLDESVKQKLRMMGAAQGRSMEAQAREMLTLVVQQDDRVVGASVAHVTPPAMGSKNKGQFDHLVGIWKGRMTTDELMQLTRGE